MNRSEIIRNRLYIFASWATIVMAFLFIALCFFWLFYPYNPATFNTLPHKVKPKVVDGGQFITIYVDVCKNMQIAPEISRVFVDGVVYQIPAYITVDDEVGCKVRKVQIYIPKGLPTGKYFVSTSYRFKVNPIRTVEMQTRSEQFEVVE